MTLDEILGIPKILPTESGSYCTLLILLTSTYKVSRPPPPHPYPHGCTLVAEWVNHSATTSHQTQETVAPVIVYFPLSKDPWTPLILFSLKHKGHCCSWCPVSGTMDSSLIHLIMLIQDRLVSIAFHIILLPGMWFPSFDYCAGKVHFITKSRKQKKWRFIIYCAYYSN